MEPPPAKPGLASCGLGWDLRRPGGAGGGSPGAAGLAAGRSRVFAPDGGPLGEAEKLPPHPQAPSARPASSPALPAGNATFFLFPRGSPWPPSFSGVGVDVCVFWGWGSGDHSAPGRASSFSEMCVGGSHCKPEASGAPVSPSVDWGYNFSSHKGVCGNKRRWLTQCREESELLPSFFSCFSDISQSLCHAYPFASPKPEGTSRNSRFKSRPWLKNRPLISLLSESQTFQHSFLSSPTTTSSRAFAPARPSAGNGFPPFTRSFKTGRSRPHPASVLPGWPWGPRVRPSAAQSAPPLLHPQLTGSCGLVGFGTELVLGDGNELS